MRLFFTLLLLIGYIGHGALYFMKGQSELSTAMICFAVAMWMLFQ